VAAGRTCRYEAAVSELKGFGWPEELGTDRPRQHGEAPIYSKSATKRTGDPTLLLYCISGDDLSGQSLAISGPLRRHDASYSGSMHPVPRLSLMHGPSRQSGSWEGWPETRQACEVQSPVDVEMTFGCTATSADLVDFEKHGSGRRCDGRGGPLAKIMLLRMEGTRAPLVRCMVHCSCTLTKMSSTAGYLYFSHITGFA